MNENLPTNVQLNTNANGSVTFATDVIATIAGLAATEVEGVASMAGGSSGLADILTRKMQSTRSLTKGVRVELNENTVSIHVTIVVDYGTPVPEVAQNIQENVKKAIETMSGLTVTGVDVHVQGVSFERENRSAVELEMQQRLLLQKQQADERAKVEEVPMEPAAEKAEKAEDAAPSDAPAQTEEEPDDDEFDLQLDDIEPESGILDDLSEDVAPDGWDDNPSGSENEQETPNV